MEHHGNSKETGIQPIDTSNTDSNTVRSPNVSAQESREFQSLSIPHPRENPMLRILNSLSIPVGNHRCVCEGETVGKTGEVDEMGERELVLVVSVRCGKE